MASKRRIRRNIEKKIQNNFASSYESDCEGKFKYYSIEDAEQAVIRLRRRFGYNSRIYDCPHCDALHTTKKSIRELMYA